GSMIGRAGSRKSSASLASHSAFGTGWRSTIGLVMKEASDRSGGEDGLIAHDRRAMHHTAFRGIMRRDRVNRAAIVPHQHVVRLPSVLVHEPRSRREFGQIVD